MSLESKASNWEEAVSLLKQGNDRFVSGKRSQGDASGVSSLSELQGGQKPFAIIVTCSDSRVPPELLFDQGVGDLFIIRVAGNIAQSSQLASIEYAAAVLGSPLVVIMGHSKCGAVKATVGAELNGDPAPSESLGELIELIRPAVKEAVQAKGSDEAAVLDEGIRRNVVLTAKQVADTGLIKDAVDKGAARVVQAVFHLESGKVEFMD